MQKIKGWRKKKSGVAERENSCGNCRNVVQLRVRYRSFFDKLAATEAQEGEDHLWTTY